MPKKKINRTPRRKRMKRQSRLQAAKHWIPTYNGKNLIKGYQNWFGVDLLCAIQELKMLGIELDDQYVHQALYNREKMIAARQKKFAEKKRKELENFPIDSDENFYYIAGYTSWGVPYGLAWEEAASLEPENPMATKLHQRD
jgi:hypothetical protein